MSDSAAQPGSAIRAQALRVESDFISAVESALRAAQGKLLAGETFELQSGDNAEAVHKAIVDRRMFGESLRRSLPAGRAIFQRGYKRGFLWGRRQKSVAVASVLAPPGPLLDGAPPPPVTRNELHAHLLELVGKLKRDVLHVVGVCSPSGFAADVVEGPMGLSNVKLVLIEPRPGGGWKVAPQAPGMDERLVRLFDPEGVSEKMIRIRREIESRREELLLSGMSAAGLAARLNVPAPMVETVFAALSHSEPELRVARRSGETVLFRGAEVSALQEKTMTFLDRIRSLFSGESDSAEKINHLIEKRTALSQRRDRIYEDVARLEKREAGLVDEGRGTESQVAKKRLAAQVVQVRKEIERWNTIAGMLNQQLNIINTDIHNLTLLQQGQIARLPSAEELTEHAVAAEEMLETLSADAKLVEGLETHVAEQVVTDEEAAVLAEFDRAPSAPEPARPAQVAQRDAGVPPLPQASPAAARPEKPQAE
ncbi:MAG: hypothetical protein U1A27_09320 [Phycisphaerae bacterium]